MPEFDADGNEITEFDEFGKEIAPAATGPAKVSRPSQALPLARYVPLDIKTLPKLPPRFYPFQFSDAGDRFFHSIDGPKNMDDFEFFAGLPHRNSCQCPLCEPDSYRKTY